nr:hypothetical protein [Bacilli bacterium]
MRKRKSFSKKADVILWLTIGAKLMMYWAVFLLGLESLCYFGITQAMSKTLDQIAMMVTLLLLLVSTIGVKWAIRFIKQDSRRHDMTHAVDEEVSVSR